MTDTLIPAARDILANLIAFDTTSRNSNLDLIVWVENYLGQHGVASSRVVNADASKANLYATVGPNVEGGIILSGHSDVVPVDGQEGLSGAGTRRRATVQERYETGALGVQL